MVSEPSATMLLLAAQALAADPLAASQPGLTILDPLSASMPGLFLFGEHIQAGIADLAGTAKRAPADDRSAGRGAGSSNGVLVLGGRAGMGKTALLREMAERAASGECVAHRGRACSDSRAAQELSDRLI
jgi:hypothetical protein